MMQQADAILLFLAVADVLGNAGFDGKCHLVGVLENSTAATLARNGKARLRKPMPGC
jgi:hypothetical protein